MSPEIVGRYAIYGEIASGGMAAVYYGRLLGPDGFSRPVAIKRLHAHLAKDPQFVAMFRDEARLAARVRHPNVVSILDVVVDGEKLCIVMDYVHGESLANLVRSLKGKRVPVPVACAIVVGILHGLHAAHEASGDAGEALGIVHRDVSPHNVVVGLDGVARVVDFGVAKAVVRLQTTREGTVKGKFAYMAPEQVRDEPVSRRTDVYAASVVLWELLTGQRLFTAGAEAGIVAKIVSGTIDAPSARAPDLPEALNAITLRGLARNPADRYETARAMAREIEKEVKVATTSEVGEWIESVVGRELQARAGRLASVEPTENMTMPSSASSPGWEGTKTDGALSLASESAARAASAETRNVPPRRRPLTMIAGGVTLLAIAAIAFIASRAALTSGMSTRAPVLAPAAPSPPIVPAVAVPIETPPPAQSDPTPEPPETSVATAAPGVSSLPPASSGPKAKPGRPGLVHSKPQALPPRKPSTCTPPYTTDEEGTRHYKLECL